MFSRVTKQHFRVTKNGLFWAIFGYFGSGFSWFFPHNQACLTCRSYDGEDSSILGTEMFGDHGVTPPMV